MPDSGISIKPISITGTRRVFEFAFDYARRMGRRKITAVHKANIMKFTDGLWLRVARAVAAENPDIEFDDRIADNMCMQLVQWPEEYDVMVLPNLYGDIISDLAAGLIGGLGVAPGANFGRDVAVFEPTHGSAPKYAGQNKVNPIAQMLSGMLMLRHLDEIDAADRLEAAIADLIREGKSLTYDMKPSRDDPTAVGTSQVADALIEKLQSRGASYEPRARSPSSAPGTSARRARRCSRRATTPTSCSSTSRKACRRGRRSTSPRWARCSATSRTITGTNGYEETAGSAVVVITAGVPRGPGMSRDDLVATNEKIVADVTAKVVAQSPDAVLIVVSNPLDAMCHVAKNVSGLAARARARHGRHPRHGALLDLHRLGDRLVAEGRPDARARRPRRPDGARSSAPRASAAFR